MLHFVYSIRVDDVSFISKAQSRRPTRAPPVFKCSLVGPPKNGSSSFPAHTLCSNGLIWLRTPLGPWRQIARLGFSFSAGAPARDRSTLPQVTPFSRRQIVSTFIPIRPVWWASWHTQARGRLPACSNASHNQDS